MSDDEAYWSRAIRQTEPCCNSMNWGHTEQPVHRRGRSAPERPLPAAKHPPAKHIMGATSAYSLCYFATFLAAVLLTPFVGSLARRWGIVDLPNARKVHALPTPRIGGVAISASMFVVLVPLLLFTNIITLHDVLDHSRLTTLLGSAFFIAMVGLADDVFDLPATYKLIALLAAGAAPAPRV